MRYALCRAIATGTKTLQPKTIKFDLPVDGTTVATADELRSHFTADILDHFRKGVLARWLRTRPELSTALAAVEELPADGDAEPTLLALCKAFRVDADEHTVKAALADPTGVPSRASKRMWQSRASVVDRRNVASARGHLSPGLDDRWLFHVPEPALVRVAVNANVDVACTLENERGRQWATDGTRERKQSASFFAILSRGRYYIRLVAGDQGELGHYDLQLEQVRRVSEPLVEELRIDRDCCVIRDLTTELDNSQKETQQRATLSRGEAHIWVIKIPARTAVIDTLGSTDTIGRLLSPTGRVLQEDDDSGQGSNFLIRSSHTLSGEFAVLVQGYSIDTKGDYDIRVRLQTGSARLLNSTGLRIVWDEFNCPDLRF